MGFSPFRFSSLLGEENRSELGDRGRDQLSHYQYVRGTGSANPTDSFAGTQVSVEEIRSAPNVSDYYPPSLHGALVSSPEPDPRGMQLLCNLFMEEQFVGVDDFDLLWKFYLPQVEDLDMDDVAHCLNFLFLLLVVT